MNFLVLAHEDYQLVLLDVLRRRTKKSTMRSVAVFWKNREMFFETERPLSIRTQTSIVWEMIRLGCPSLFAAQLKGEAYHTHRLRIWRDYSNVLLFD